MCIFCNFTLWFSHKMIDNNLLTGPIPTVYGLLKNITLLDIGMTSIEITYWSFSIKQISTSTICLSTEIGNNRLSGNLPEDLFEEDLFTRRIKVLSLCKLVFFVTFQFHWICAVLIQKNLMLVWCFLSLFQTITNLPVKFHIVYSNWHLLQI